MSAVWLHYALIAIIPSTAFPLLRLIRTLIFVPAWTVVAAEKFQTIVTSAVGVARFNVPNAWGIRMCLPEETLITVALIVITARHGAIPATERELDLRKDAPPATARGS